MTTSSLDRKLERVAREIAEQKAREKPMTEQEFEKGDHQIDGGVVETPEPNYNYGIFAGQTVVDAQMISVRAGDPSIVLYVKTGDIWTPVVDLHNFRYGNFRYVETDERN